MAGYLLNISVDTPDGTPKGVSEDLSINDQESLIEIVLEQVMGFENALAEFDDPDADDQHKKKESKSVFFSMSISANDLVIFKPYSKARYLITNQPDYPEERSDLDSPPPKS
jgi:hypothetical protein